MAQKKFYKNEIIRKALLITLLVIGLVILSYIFVLPGYVIHKIENAKFISVWCGDIMFETDNVDLISDIVQSIDTSTWERKITDDTRKDMQRLPDMYITVDNKYEMDFWVTQDVCRVHICYHSSRIEIGIYEMDIENYNECVEYLANCVS